MVGQFSIADLTGADAEKLEEFLHKLQHRVDTLQEENTRLLNDQDASQKRLRLAQQEVYEARQQYDRLESQLFGKEKEVDHLRKENHNISRIRKDLANRLKQETQQHEKERQAWMEKEAELTAQLKRQAMDRRRFTVSGPPRNPNGDDERVWDIRGGQGQPDGDGPDQQQQLRDRDALIAARTIRAQDKLIQELRTDLNHLESSKAQLQSEWEQQGFRVLQLESELGELKQVNQTLMEDNESYQLLLHERTVNGDFTLAGLGDHHDNSNSALSELGSQRTPTDSTVFPEGPSLVGSSLPTSPGNTTPFPTSAGLGMDLAAELDRAFVSPQGPNSDELDKALRAKEDQIDKLRTEIKQLEKEVKNHKDENKALSLYVNKILGRIMNNGMLQQVLAQDYAASRDNGKAGKSVGQSTGVAASQESMQDRRDPLAGGPGNVNRTDSALAVSGGDTRNRPTKGVLNDIGGDDDEDENLDAMTRAARTAARLRAQKEQRRRSVDPTQYVTSPVKGRVGRANTIIGAQRPAPILTQRGATVSPTSTQGSAGSAFRSVFSLLSPRSTTITAINTSTTPSTDGGQFGGLPQVNQPNFQANPLSSETAAAASWEDIDEEEDNQPLAHLKGSPPMGMNRRATTIVFASPSNNLSKQSIQSSTDVGSIQSQDGGHGSGSPLDVARARQMRRHYSVSTGGDAQSSPSSQQMAGANGGYDSQDTAAEMGWKAAWKRMSSATPWKH
ncbi:hypothetical protein IWQ61_003737 [Dispira simplex]|nr:hypothetical protein IWQ61_003737 [Dispira simplex]